MASPKPELPPVTKAVRPDRSNETGELLMTQCLFVNGRPFGSLVAGSYLHLLTQLKRLTWEILGQAVIGRAGVGFHAFEP
jgi:hypothetical protein